MLGCHAENVSPCPKHPHAKEFLSDTEVQNLQQMAIEIINKESHLSLSAKYKTLLEMLQCSTSVLDEDEIILIACEAWFLIELRD